MDIICWRCGDIATKAPPTSYWDAELGMMLEYNVERELSVKFRCYCDKCYEIVREKEKAELAEYVRLKKRVMFNRALNLLEKQSTNMYEYKEAIEVVEDHMNRKPDKYDSSYEVIAAIVLVQNRIVSKMQYRIGKYQVDFLLPEIGVVLEIDGERHKNRKKYDSERDAYIKQQLGYGWDIIRIKTEYLDMNASRLVDAIDKVIEYRETNHIPWRKLS